MKTEINLFNFAHFLFKPLFLGKHRANFKCIVFPNSVLTG